MEWLENVGAAVVLVVVGSLLGYLLYEGWLVLAGPWPLTTSLVPLALRFLFR